MLRIKLESGVVNAATESASLLRMEPNTCEYPQPQGPFRGGESVLASRSSRETLFLAKEAFSSTCVMGDSVPFHGPAAREYARATYHARSGVTTFP